MAMETSFSLTHTSDYGIGSYTAGRSSLKTFLAMGNHTKGKMEAERQCSMRYLRKMNT
jgi:hypothetical protein